MAVHAYSAMDSYIYGFALQEKTPPGDIPADPESRLERLSAEHPSPADEYPYLAEVVVEPASRATTTPRSPSSAWT
jgi:hypothetical protein